MTETQVPQDEIRVGIIPNTSRKKGLFGRENFNLIVTDHRIIGAKITSEMLKQAAKEASEASKTKGEGLLKRMWNTAASGFKYHERYFEISFDEILREQPENFSLPLSEITQVKFRSGDTEMNTADTMEIQSSRGKEQYELKSSAGEAKKILKHVIPDKIKTGILG